MKRTLLALLLAACGSPILVAPDGAAPPVDSAPACLDPCIDGYERADFYPRSDIYCRPTGDVLVDNPCTTGTPIAWMGSGVRQCPRPAETAICGE